MMKADLVQDMGVGKPHLLIPSDIMIERTTFKTNQSVYFFLHHKNCFNRVYPL